MTLFCRHKLTLIQWRKIIIHDERGNFPKTNTNLNFVCSKCGKFKSKRFHNEDLTAKDVAALVQAKGWEVA